MNISEKALKLFRSGKKQIEIARFLGVYKQRIHQIVKRYKPDTSMVGLILERDDYMCVMCGSVKKLNIHHIDKNSKNNSIRNLVTLCHKCHMFAHTRNISMEQKYSLRITKY